MRKKGGKNKKSECYGLMLDNDTRNNQYYPTSIVSIHNSHQKQKIHPTQKPVALMQYLIRTYSNPGETVLDNCMGSGTTGIAANAEGRDFIGIEMDAEYYRIATEQLQSYNKTTLGGAGNKPTAQSEESQL